MQTRREEVQIMLDGYLVKGVETFVRKQIWRLNTKFSPIFHVKKIL
jgi:hypothetical protein